MRALQGMTRWRSCGPVLTGKAAAWRTWRDTARAATWRRTAPIYLGGGSRSRRGPAARAMASGATRRGGNGGDASSGGGGARDRTTKAAYGEKGRRRVSHGGSRRGENDGERWRDSAEKSTAAAGRMT